MNTATSRFAIAAATLGVALAGCGGSSAPSIPPSGLHVHYGASSSGEVLLSALGAQRIGLRIGSAVAVPAPPAPPIVKTTVIHGVVHKTNVPAPKPASPVGGPTVIVPYSAVVYDPNGNAYVFKKVARLTYVEVPVAIDHVSGNSAYLTNGPRPSAKVVTVGAEELYGVQTGVLAQS